MRVVSDRLHTKEAIQAGLVMRLDPYETIRELRPHRSGSGNELSRHD
jgi:hypothetical protein